MALMALSSAFAQESSGVKYREGTAISSASELTSGKYFIKAHCNANNHLYNMARGEGILYDPANSNSQLNQLSDYYIAGGATDNTAAIWEVEVSTENLPAGATGDKVFTIKNLATQKYPVLNGTGVNANKYNFTVESAGTDAKPIAQFQLVEMPEDYPQASYYGQYKDNIRFHFQLTNGTFANGDYPYVHTNGNNNNQNASLTGFSYWTGATPQNTAVQFELIEAEEITGVNIKFTLPAINGIAIPEQTVYASLGESPEQVIATAAAALGKGGFKVTGLTSSTGNNTVTEEGQSFQVEGTWERELIPYHVYRLRINPNDALHGAIRYMLSTEEIETKREASYTLTRLVPERLWYFAPTDEAGKYTLHTLYDTESAVYFPTSDNKERAKLSKDNATVFTVVNRESGDIVLTFNNGMVNDMDGFMCYWNQIHHDDNGSQIRLYLINDLDLDVLSDFGTEEQINAAKAAPTVENVKPLIDAYNAVNTEAALKRVDYLFSTGVIGNNPGQYSDPDGSFAAAVETLRAVANNPDATEEEIAAAIAAVDVTGVNADDLTLNPLTPGFYRFRGGANVERYLSSISGGNAAGRTAMGMTKDNTRSNTVFYIQEKTVDPDDAANNTYIVMGFDDGLVLPNLNSATSWMPNVLGHSDSSVEVTFNPQDNARFIIHVGEQPNGSHRHLHDGGAGGTNANAGGGTDAPYTFYIERVTELPATFYNVITDDPDKDNDGWSSIYSPVALEIPAEYTHLSAYTGEFDGADYSDKADINHVLATKIEPIDGKVIIPANQPTLLFYDGELSREENEFLAGGLLEGRETITYVNLHIVDNTVAPANQEIKGNLKGSFLAIEPESGKEYYTLHASHSNNFREYAEWANPNYNYIPGFKVYIDNQPDGVEYYPIYTINPNTMVPQFDENGNNVGLSVSKNQDSGEFTLTITTPADDYTVYYKHTPDTAPQAIRRQANDVAEDFTDIADKDGKVHTITVSTPGTVEYYAYHAASNTKGAVRQIPINDEVATGIKSITVDQANSAVCFDLQGRRIAAPVKGINIINGNKVMVK